MTDCRAPDPLSTVREGYDRWARIYEHDGNPLIALAEPYMQEAVGDVHGLDVLDLGCGTGRHAMWLATAGANVTAIDFSQGMLEEARRKPEAPRVNFLLHDFHEPLPLSTGKLDLVISSLVLEHVRDLRAFFTEARRVTRSGGRAVVSAMHPAMFLRGIQAHFTDPESGERVHPGSVNHSFAEIVMSALHSGFMIESIDEYAPDIEFAAQYPRAEKYIGWPMLIVLQLGAV